MENQQGQASALVDTLMSDVVHAHNAIQEADTQFSRRAYVRVLFASIEGAIFYLKLEARYWAGEMGIPFSEAELGFMRDKTYELKDNGEVKETTAKIRLESNVKFAFKVYNRALGVDRGLDTGSSGYKAFTESVKIRDRITHPKSVEQLDISDDEMGLLAEGSGWLWGNLMMVLNTTGRVQANQKKTLAKEAILSGRLTAEALQRDHGFTPEQAEQIVREVSASLLRQPVPPPINMNAIEKPVETTEGAGG